LRNNDAYQRLVTKLEELDAYTHTVLHQFPKLERHLLCAEMRASMNKLCRLVVVAWKRRQKSSSLFELDVEVEVFRQYIRKAHRLEYINTHRLEVWMKHANRDWPNGRRPGSSTKEPPPCRSTTRFLKGQGLIPAAIGRTGRTMGCSASMSTTPRRTSTRISAVASQTNNARSRAAYGPLSSAYPLGPLVLTVLSKINRALRPVAGNPADVAAPDHHHHQTAERNAANRQWPVGRPDHL